MANQDTVTQIRGFTGLNNAGNPGAIEDTELTTATNVNVGNAGELVKRTGLEKMHNGTTLGSNPVVLLGHFITDSISQLIVKAGNKVYYSTDAATFTEIDTYADAEWGVQYANNFYILRSENEMVLWDGASDSTISDSPSGTFAIMYKERMYVLNTKASGTLSSRLYFSDAGDVSATGWPSTNFFDIQPGDGDFLISLVIIQDLLVIFKGRGTWALYVQGQLTDWIIRSLNNELGCISKYATKLISGYLYFSSEKGVFRTDGTLFTEISRNIESLLINRVVNLTTVNQDAFGHWGDQLICRLVPNSGSTIYYVYHYLKDAWTLWEFSGGLMPQTFLEIVATSPGTGLYCGDANSTGVVHRYGSSVYSDGGVTYSVEIATKEFDMGIPTNYKRGKWVGIDIIGTGAPTYENEADYAVASSGSFTSNTTRSIAKIPGPGFFRVWKFTLTLSSSSSMTLLGIVIHMSAHRALIKANT